MWKNPFLGSVTCRIIHKRIHKILPSIVTYLCAKVCFFPYCPLFLPLLRHLVSNQAECFCTGILTQLYISGGRFLAVQTGLYPHELTYSFKMNDTKDSIKEKDGEVQLTSY